jgi:ABC-type Fe3+-hydroxamate transport system substrate-binding protein
METIRYTDGPNFEATAATRPDVILTAFGDETYQRRLAEIAPTIFVDYSAGWREVLRSAAVPLFRDAEAEQAINGIEARYAEFQERFSDRAGRTPCVLYVGEDDALTVMTKESSLSETFVDLGFAPLARSGDIYGEAVSPELVSAEATGDFLVLMVGLWRLDDPNEPVPDRITALIDSAVLSSAPAARGGVYVFPDEGGRAGYYLNALYLPTWVEMLGMMFEEGPL